MKPRAYSTREKTLGALMVGVVSVFFLQRFVVAPYRTRVDQLETLQARKGRQLQRIRTILASRKDIEADYARRFDSRTGSRPLQGEMGTFLKSIEKLAREKNVRVLDIRPSPIHDRNSAPSAELRGQSAAQRADLPSAPFLSAHFVTESTWPALANLLVSLEDQRVTIEKVTLTRARQSTQSPQELKAQLQLAQE